MSVIDLGGTVETWLRAPIRPRRVTVVNLNEAGRSADAGLVPVIGDACVAREVLSAAGIELKFDLVFSNSLIEHVGGHAMRSRLAEEIHMLAPRHWIQTPYRYFPIEPHWLFPLMQFLPLRARLPIAQRWPLAHTVTANRSEALGELMWTDLVGITQMKFYFPQSEILRERIMGMTKSTVAVLA